MPPKPDQDDQPQGADRFWGQFSQSTAGRSGGNGDGERKGTAADTEPETTAGHGSECLEWCPICRSAELFKATVSPELRQQAETIQHEAIGVLKAFLDAYTEKAGGTGQHGAGESHREQPEDPPPPRVTEIPLD